MVWAVMWFFLIYNSPAMHPRISIEEREYIEKALNTKASEKVRKYIKFCIIISVKLSFIVTKNYKQRCKIANLQDICNISCINDSLYILLNFCLL